LRIPKLVVRILRVQVYKFFVSHAATLSVLGNACCYGVQSFVPSYCSARCCGL
jgi:hypothetical protein